MLLVKPSPFVRDLKAYQVSALPSYIDLPLGGTERPVTHTDPTVSRYPHAHVLEAFLAERFGVATEQVFVTAGADESLDRLCRSFLAPGRHALMTTPTFEMIKHYATLAGGSVDRIAWLDGEFPLAAALQAITAETSAIFVVSPNNPTGNVVSPQAIKKLAETAPQAVVVVDMAYGEYANNEIATEVLQQRNVVVVRTLSKAYGSPGLRIGYTLGDAEVLSWMRAAGGPYSVAHASLEKAGDVLLQDITPHLERIRLERQVLRAELEKLGVHALPSQANFVLAFFSQPAWTRSALASLGISTRALTHEKELQNALRITCPGDEKAFTRLLHGLQSVMRPEALIFDMDGVLADVSHSYRQAIIDTAATYDVQLTRDEVRAIKAEGHANNDWEVTLRLLQRHGIFTTIGEVTERFESIYQGTDDQPGLRATEKLLCAPDLLERLSKKLPLAVVTGRPRSDAERFLRDNGITPFFKTLVCMYDAPLKPDPAPVLLALQRLGVQSGWMIGDTVDDAWAARRACVVPLGISPPGDDVSNVLLQAGVARVLTKLNEIEDML
jgi:histidinol-phosphate aminotransferase